MCVGVLSGEKLEAVRRAYEKSSFLPSYKIREHFVCGQDIFLFVYVFSFVNIDSNCLGISRDQYVKHLEDGFCSKEAIPMGRDGMSKVKGGVICSN